MSGWQWQRMGILDTETTAPDPEEARVVTICTGQVSGRVEPEVTQQVVNPGVEIPQGAIEIHGVTNERAIAEGIDPAAGADFAQQWLGWIWDQGLPVVAFNATYDLTVIDRECRRHLGHGIEVTGPVVDPFVLDRQVDKYRKGSRKLDATAAHYGVRLDAAHDATEDALAAGRVAWAIAQKYPEIAAMTLEDLHEAQIGWHAARQADFRAYLVRTGKPADDVDGHWPLRPMLVGSRA